MPDWLGWYRRQSSFQPDPVHFGAYVTLAVDEVLYIGMGSSRPAEMDGALLLRYDGSLQVLGRLDEQGIHEMLWDGERLHIAGTDPCCGDGWEAGNHYTYRPGEGLRKYRDPEHGLVGVLHTWGLWKDKAARLYAAVSMDQNQLPGAQLFVSEDEGVHWRHLATLGGGRAYDVIGFDNALYAIYNERETEPLYLARSQDGGATWHPLALLPLQRVRLVPFAGHLVAVSEDRQALYAVQGNRMVPHPLPEGFLIGAQADYSDYNLLVVAEGALYTIWEEPAAIPPRYYLARTTDLQRWERVATIEYPLISLSYWEARRILVASSRGEAVALWQYRLPSLYLPVVQQPR